MARWSGMVEDYGGKNGFWITNDSTRGHHLKTIRISGKPTRGDKNESRALFQRAQSMFKEAKMDPSPDDQFEIDWLQDQLGKSAED
jgi:hypothetical protein